jgi:hypothetical protein
MAEAQGAFDGLRRFAVIERTPPPVDPGRADHLEVIDALDDLAEDTRAAADSAERAEDNTLAMSDQLAGIEDRVAAMRLGGTMFAVGQMLILVLILWRVW